MTRYSQGTSSYRAPELLDDEPTFTNKVDIWALGCILYELAKGKVAFREDWVVRQYYLDTSNLLSISLPLFTPFLQHHLAENILHLLERTWNERPGASNVRRIFLSYCQFLNFAGAPFLVSAQSYPSYTDWSQSLNTSSSESEFLYQIADTFERKGEHAVGIVMRRELLQNDATTRYEAITHPTLASRDGSVDVNTGRALQLVTDESIQTDPLSKYLFLATIGRSYFATHFLAESKETHCLYAIKTVKKDFLVENDEIKSIRSEQQVFLLATKKHHPFLVYLHSFFQTETRVYFVMEHIAGGDLLFHIQKTSFSPKQTLFLSFLLHWLI